MSIQIQMTHRQTRKRFSSAIHLQLRLNTNRNWKRLVSRKFCMQKQKKISFLFFFFVFGFSFFLYFSSFLIFIFVLFRWENDRNNGYCNKLCARLKRCDGKGKCEGVDMSVRIRMNLRKNLAIQAIEMGCFAGKENRKKRKFLLFWC